MKLILTSIAFLSISACTKEASFSTVESSRQKAKDNALVNAQALRGTNDLLEQKIYMRGDSTISASCPQGDGWASVDLKDKNGKVTKELKCSTVSAALGCMDKKDFIKRPAYAKQEGNCNGDIPHPLPTVGQ